MKALPSKPAAGVPAALVNTSMLNDPATVGPENVVPSKSTTLVGILAGWKNASFEPDTDAIF
jgi:hypothetical protein